MTITKIMEVIQISNKFILKSIHTLLKINNTSIVLIYCTMYKYNSN